MIDSDSGTLLPVLTENHLDDIVENSLCNKRPRKISSHVNPNQNVDNKFASLFTRWC